MTVDINTLKFPIGPFVAPENISDEDFQSLINTIEEAPAKYRRIAEGLSSSDLQKTYRDGS